MNTEQWKGVPISGPILRPREAAQYLGIGTVTLYEEIRSGRLPPLVKISSRATGMPRGVLDHIISTRFNESLGETGRE